MRSAGFVVTHASYVNVLPALYAVLRTCRRRREAAGHHHEHRLYQGLGIQETVLAWPWLNRLLVWILAAEGRYVATTRHRLPFGHTIIAVGEKAR